MGNNPNSLKTTNHEIESNKLSFADSIILPFLHGNEEQQQINVCKKQKKIIKDKIKQNKKVERNKSQIQKLKWKLIQQKFYYKLLDIKKENKIIAKKIVLRDYFKNFDNHFDAFHGTSFDKMHSIARHGLKKAGSTIDGKQIQIVGGHIQLGVSLKNFDNWSSAVFVSPSIFYATDSVYAKQFKCEDGVWLPVIQVKVKIGVFTEHHHSLTSYAISKYETHKPEWRIEQQSQLKEENQKDLGVVAFIFIRKEFIQNANNYLETSQLLLNSIQQQQMKQNAVLF